MLSRARSEVKHFWLWSRRFIIPGVLAVWLLTNPPAG
jgi:ferrous iron transport protein B